MGATILIADDLSFMRMIQKEILTERGYTIVGEASDGIEAVDKFQSLHPDLVLLDITMPNMNGLEAMRKIFSIDPRARVIMCSALGQQNLIVDELIEEREIVIKPVDDLLNAQRLFSGASILEDGRLVFILDTSFVRRENF